MNKSSITYTCLANLLVGALLLAIGSSFAVAEDFCDRKPEHPRCNPVPDPDPDPSDPCASFSAPDVVFYQDTGNRKRPKVTFYAADSNTGCEKKLVDFPTPSPGFVHDLTFSAHAEGNNYVGRIAWEWDPVDEVVDRNAVWEYDFEIVGAEINSVQGPVRVLVDEATSSYQTISNLDLSPDGTTLVYKFFHYEREPEFRVVEDSIRIVDVDDCIDSEGCSFDSENSTIVAQSANVDLDSLGSHSWGPLGDRIYFSSSSNNGDEHGLSYVDLTSAETVELITSGTDATYTGTRGIAAGLLGGRELLAVMIPTEGTYGCGHAAIVDVEACTGSGDCSVSIDPRLYGRDPSWTREGKLIYASQREGRTDCSDGLGNVGVFDNDEVSILTDGLSADGAGGIPETE